MEKNILPVPSFKALNADSDNNFSFAINGDHHDQPVDLNEQLIKNRQSTFFMRVNSEAMIGAGIHAGDVVIVDRALEVKNGKVIIAVVQGEMLIRRLEMGQGRHRLIPATTKLSPIELEPYSYTVWGVVTYVIHSL